MPVNKKYMRFGMTLRLLRNKRKIKCKDFADKVGCTKRSLYRWEHGLSYPMLVFRDLIRDVMPEIGDIK